MSMVLRQISVRRHCQYSSLLKNEKMLELSSVATRYNTVCFRHHLALSDLSILLIYPEQMLFNAVLLHRDTSLSPYASKKLNALPAFLICWTQRFIGYAKVGFLARANNFFITEVNVSMFCVAII